MCVHELCACVYHIEEGCLLISRDKCYILQLSNKVYWPIVILKYLPGRSVDDKMTNMLRVLQVVKKSFGYQE